jgi:hypothetical protein
MQDRPIIKTAIPKRRYQIGDFGVSLLGDIESGDSCNYLYILAFVQTGQTQPALYICAEERPDTGRGDGRYQLKVINEVMSEVVDTGEKWADLDSFAEQGLALGVQALGLRQEPILRLM